MKLFTPPTTAILLVIAAIWASPLDARGPVPGPDPDCEDVGELRDLDLEALMNIEVTVASRTPQKISEIPAAVYVIPGDEIRRAGHSSIQEALRMVPGFFVSHWANDMWDVTARGFGTGLSYSNEAHLNQLLVMIDGVVVYSPLFAGTWWALQEVDLSDVDRVEITRGPGGLVWGANSVHGVVNIITKHSENTEGMRIDGRLSRDQWDSTVRYGGPLGDNGHVRVWGKTTHYDTPHSPWMDTRSDWEMGTGGFRADWETESGLQYTAWGRGYDGNFRDVGWEYLGTDGQFYYFQPHSTTAEKHGGQIALSLTDPETNSRWQAYYSRDQQNHPYSFDQDIDIFDLEYQRDSRISDRHRITWGAGYQVIRSVLSGENADVYFLRWDPAVLVQNNFRAFLLDTIDFPDQNLQVVLGAQALHSEFTDFDLQPSVRVRWMPSEEFMSWAGVSRAARTPSLEEVSLDDNSQYAGRDDFQSEELTAYEMGFRRVLSDTAALDLSLFYNQYDKLHVAVYDPITFWGGRVSNKGDGSAYGAELAVDLRPTDRWSMRGAYSYIHSEMEYRPYGSDLGTDEYYPQHIINLRSYYDLGEKWEIDGALYGIRGFGDGYDSAEYWRADLRLGWHPTEEIELSLGVQNACDPHHPEYGGANQNEIRRAVFLQLIYRK
jgi:iron complex outermembrane recepter protein